MQANTETARNFSLRPSLPNKLHHQASLLLRTFSCFQSIQLGPLKAIPPFPLTPIPCHTSDPHPLTLGPFACDPSQKGACCECLHPHQATLLASVISALTGTIPVSLCDPSQNGCPFERPQAHHQ